MCLYEKWIFLLLMELYNCVQEHRNQGEKQLLRNC